MAKRKMRSSWGSTREVGSGIWEVRYRITDATDNGVPKSERIRGTRSQAESRLAALRVKYEGTGASSELTVGEYWKGWFEPSLVRPQYAPKTISQYKSNYKCHIAPAFGNRIMTSITPREIQDWLNSMTYGAASHCKATLSAIYGQACGVDLLIDTNVMSMARYRIPRKSVSSGRTVNDGTYDIEMADAVYGAIKGEFFEPAWILSCFGGCRREEAVGCRPEEDFEVMDTDAGKFVVYSVKRGVQRDNGEVIVVPTKNETSEGFAIIQPPYSTLLLELTHGNKGWIIDNGSGGPVDPEIMAKAWQRWYQRNPYVYVPWKNLRNSYVTLMHAKGYDIETVSKLARHSDVKTTSKIYDRPTSDTLVKILLRGVA